MAAKKFTTVKQVKEALWTQRQLLLDKYADGQGKLPFIYAETMDGNHGRIYHLAIAITGEERLRIVRPFEEFSNWIQGGLPKNELLNWANETLSLS